MIRKSTIAAAAIAILSTPVLAAPCRDAKGKFTKCTSHSGAAAGGVVKDAKGRCHIASGAQKGRFTKC